MERERRLSKPSPLRNSNAVNRPFHSPLRSSVISPRGIERLDEKQSPHTRLGSSAYVTTPEKRILGQPRVLAKKICVTQSMDMGGSVDCDDLDVIKTRINAKKQQIVHLKQQLLYKKKHETRDLNNLTERWLRGCQGALMQFQKDLSQQRGTAVNMIEILGQLGIPAELVQYSVEDCEFE